MGFIILEAENPNLSYVIKKNPMTLFKPKPIRKGICFGWYHDENTTNGSSDCKETIESKSNTCYVMRFIDSGEEVSFPRHRGDKNDYLPYMQYCAPHLMSCIIKEMLGTALNQGSEYDMQCKCSLKQGVVKLSGKAINLIDKMNTFVKQYTIVILPTNVPKIYKLTIASESSTVSNLLQYAYLLGWVFTCLTFHYIESPDIHVLRKLIGIMNNLNIPYYIRYVLKNYLFCRKNFDTLKVELEGKESISMVYGNTQSQRYDFIFKHVLNFCNETIDTKTNIHLVDIGCGEGYYVKKLITNLRLKNIPIVQYCAHDIDENEMDKIFKMIKTEEQYASVVKAYRSIDQLATDLNALTKDDKIMIIFSEVVEHIPIDQVKEFMVNVISRINFSKMLTTTPGSEFNVNYLLEPGTFRHPDHKQEFTRKEFESFMANILAEVHTKTNKDIKSEYHLVGDTVDGIGMSQGIVLSC